MEQFLPSKTIDITFNSLQIKQIDMNHWHYINYLELKLHD